MSKMDTFKAGLAEAFGTIPRNKEDALAAKSDFEQSLEGFDTLDEIAAKAGRTKAEIAGAALAGFVTLLVGGIFYKPLGILMTRLFGLLYPGYLSFKAIESEEPEDDTQWLTYWEVFAVFTLIEETLLRSVESYMQVFFVVKIVFLLWCWHPKTRGALFLYEEFVGPYLRTLDEQVQAKLHAE